MGELFFRTSSPSCFFPSFSIPCGQIAGCLMHAEGQEASEGRNQLAQFTPQPGRRAAPREWWAGKEGVEPRRPGTHPGSPCCLESPVSSQSCPAPPYCFARIDSHPQVISISESRTISLPVAYGKTQCSPQIPYLYLTSQFAPKPCWFY